MKLERRLITQIMLAETNIFPTFTFQFVTNYNKKNKKSGVGRDNSGLRGWEGSLIGIMCVSYAEDSHEEAEHV